MTHNTTFLLVDFITSWIARILNIVLICLLVWRSLKRGSKNFRWVSKLKRKVVFVAVTCSWGVQAKHSHRTHEGVQRDPTMVVLGNVDREHNCGHGDSADLATNLPVALVGRVVGLPAQRLLHSASWCARCDHQQGTYMESHAWVPCCKNLLSLETWDDIYGNDIRS